MSESEKEEEMRQVSDLLYRAVVETSPDSVAVTDLLGRLIFCSKQTAVLHGYDRPEDLIGTSAFSLFPASEVANAARYMELTRSGGVIKNVEFVLLRKDGTTFPGELSAAVIRNEFGLPVAFMAIVRDISQRKTAEENIKRLNTELEQRVAERTVELEARNQELESLSYNIAHDMRSPVRAMVGYSSMLQQSQGANLDEDARLQVNKIHFSAKQLGLLIDSFLEYLRLGRASIRKQLVEAGRVLESVRRQLLAENADRDIQITIGELPACQADPVMLNLVWMHLLSNAIKFTRTRSQAVIQIGAGEKDGQPYYFIRDNGIGFDMKYVDKIFLLFQHLNNVEEYEGHGTGLAIVHRIIQRHGGQIWADAELGKGATIYFSL